MRRGGKWTKRAVGGFNAAVLRLRSSRRWGGRVRRYLTIVTYTGRRSGREFRIPVGFRRSGDLVTIGVRLPEAKSWWRNFTGAGGPISLELDETSRTGHATAHRDAKGRVTVTVRLAAKS
ncbi:hypothetical protein [Amycolatopsis magusensis]|uniref:hypothetical protein n=1 Tax=Amycolatopsis magusensis TaxID=882444 RepID=UPI001AEA0E19|nr:hypothetical protein [Amycolatopsis magusensis]